MKKIVILVENFFTTRDYERFGVEVLERRGFAVDVWDMTRIMHAASKVALPLGDVCAYSGLVSIDSVEFAEKSIQSLQGSEIILSLVSYSNRSLRYLYRPLKRKNNRLGIMFLGVVFPEPAREQSDEGGKLQIRLQQSKLYALMAKLQHLSIKSLIGVAFRIKRRLIRNILLSRSKKPDFALVSGTKAIYYIPDPITEKTVFIDCHALDYDVYLRNEAEGKPRGISGKYAVFIDMYVPFHPDYELLGLEYECTVDDYFPPLVAFFDLIESFTGCEVIIAAHPKAEYERHPDFFAGRKIIRNETINLVKYSDFVMTHSSTALNYAVLYGKPLLLLTQDTYSDVFKRQVEALAWSLEKTSINLSHVLPENVTNALGVDEDAYAQYIEKYIKKPGSPRENTWEIFADYCETL
jgi:hypothetical protein